MTGFEAGEWLEAVGAAARAVDAGATVEWLDAGAAAEARIRGHEVTVEVADGRIEIRAGDLDAADPGALLARNATLPAGLRIAWPAGAWRPCVMSEVEAAGAVSATRLAAVLASITDVLDGAGRAHTQPTREGEMDRTADVWRRAAAALGCEAHERDDGSAAVDLDVARAFRQAEMRPLDACVRVFLSAPADAPAGVSVDPAVEPPAAACATAAATYLLRATAALRGVRAACDGAGTRESGCDPAARPALRGLRLEVCVAPDATADEAEDALRALTLAARMCASEAEILCAHESVARAYLAAAAHAAQRSRTNEEARPWQRPQRQRPSNSTSPT